MAALVAAIHALLDAAMKSWMAGTSPAMTALGDGRSCANCLGQT